MYGRYHLRRRPVDEVIELVELGEKPTYAPGSCRAVRSGDSIWRSRSSGTRI